MTIDGLLTMGWLDDYPSCIICMARIREKPGGETGL
jgi:hypothetical protein